MSRSELRRLDLSVHQRVKDREVAFYSTDRTAALHLAEWAEDEIGWNFSEEDLPKEGLYRVIVELGGDGSEPVEADGNDFAEAVARAAIAAADAAGRG